MSVDIERAEQFPKWLREILVTTLNLGIRIAKFIREALGLPPVPRRAPSTSSSTTSAPSPSPTPSSTASSLLARFSSLFASRSTTVSSSSSSSPQSSSASPSTPPVSCRTVEIRQIAEATLRGFWRENKNIVFVGRTKATKSSLINGLRGLSPSSPFACPIGIVGVDTVLSPYPFPGHLNLVLWDAPGAGDAMNPIETYFESNYLAAFDLIVIVYSDSFTNVEALLIEKARSHHIPFLLVRGNADLGVKDLMENYETTQEASFSDLRALLQNNIAMELSRRKMRPFTDHLYVISARAMNPNCSDVIPDFDGPKLAEDLMLMFQRKL